mmetsp:Transcript_25802/g.30520  ORF Transcript_25802/g.30520 Transcript_25802/m.30520 type:complete len:230 (-) Transcript_25802:50-739(-)
MLRNPKEKTISEEVKTQRCIDYAIREGLKATCAMFVVSGSAAFTANKYSTLFKNRLSVSGKLAMVIVPTFGTALLSSELALIAAQRNPEDYGITDTDENIQQLPKNVVSTLGFHHRTANWAYENPFQLLGVSCLPIVASIFYGQTGEMKTHLKISQKIMHTRIFSQATVITTLLSLMFFRDYMDTNGIFVEAGDHVERHHLVENDKAEMKIIAQEIIKDAERRNNYRVL